MANNIVDAKYNSKDKLPDHEEVITSSSVASSTSSGITADTESGVSSVTDDSFKVPSVPQKRKCEEDDTKASAVSSDEWFQKYTLPEKNLPGTKKKKKKCEKKWILPAKSHSSNLTGPEVLFFFDLDFQKLPKPLNILNFSVISILEKMFNFICEDEGGIGDTEFKKDGKTMDEIYSYHAKVNYWLSWMKQNDIMDLKLISEVQWKSKMAHYDAQIVALMNEDRGVPAAKDVNNVFNIIKLLYEQYTKNRCAKHDCLKELFLHIKGLIELTTTNNTQGVQRVVYRSNGVAEYVLKYTVPENLVSDTCDRIASNSTIHIYPDSVFATENSWDKTSDTGRVVIEVYGPKDGSLSSEEEVQRYEEERKKKKCKEVDGVNKPERAKDAILTKKYRSESYDYLRRSAPLDCEDYHTINKLTGQHVLQLIGLAKEQEMSSRAEKYSSKEQILSSYQPLGLFLKNEYVIFSKLEISPSKLDSYFGNVFTTEKMGHANDIGKVTFSNWRLDLLQANHRIAFMVFLLELLQPEPRK